jgi:hypothetical protein
MKTYSEQKFNAIKATTKKVIDSLSAKQDSNTKEDTCTLLTLLLIRIMK